MRIGPLQVEVWRAATMQPGLSKRRLAIESARDCDWRLLRRAIDRAIDAGLLCTKDGPNHSRLVYPVAVDQLPREVVTALALYCARTTGRVPLLLRVRLEEMKGAALTSPPGVGVDSVAVRAGDLATVTDLAPKVPTAAAAPHVSGRRISA